MKQPWYMPPAVDQPDAGFESVTPLHGGDIISASQRYGLPPDQWVDLSTGINPIPYFTGPIPTAAFHRLPYESPMLLERAANYYGCSQVLPVSGTQMAIQALPSCLPDLPVLVPAIGYQEYAVQWAYAGAKLIRYPSFDPEVSGDWIERQINKDNRCHLVIINPNNPTGMRFSPQQLRCWAERLGEGGYLIVDEAFMDLTPEQSVLPRHFVDNMIVLRSFGKFFGLAGLRLGFVFAGQGICQRLRQHIGVWSVNGPAQAVAIEALADSHWQRQARNQIEATARYTIDLFAGMMEAITPERSFHEGLFSSYLIKSDLALDIQEFLALRGLLVRVVNVDKLHSLLRIGRLNPTDSQSCQRVGNAVSAYARERM